MKGTQDPERKGEETATAPKKRSNTELDVEDIDSPGASQATPGEEGTSGEEATKVSGKKKSRRKYFFVGLTFILGLLLAGAGAIMGLRLMVLDEEATEVVDYPRGPVCELKPFFISLPFPDRKKHFARLDLLLELSDRDSYQKVSRKMEEVRSCIFTVLLNSPPEKYEWGRELLAEELATSVNHLLGETLVKKVWYKKVEIM